MPISEAQVKQVKYPPELLPDSWYGNVPLNGEATPPVLQLRNFSPYLVRLVNVQIPANGNVNLRARFNDTRVDESTVAMLNLFPGAWHMPSKDTLYLNYFGLAAVPNYTTHYGLWVTKPNIAEKLVFGIKLSNEEMAISLKLGITDTVDKGLLPLTYQEQIDREYIVKSEETHSRAVVINVANAVFEVEHLYPRADEIIVLTRVAALPSAAADNVRIFIDRDKDAGIATLQTFPLSLVPGGEVACFIPATSEIRIYIMAANIPGAPPNLFRYTFQRIKLTNILRARFGLVSRDEIPGDTFDKVLAGVL